MKYINPEPAPACLVWCEFPAFFPRGQVIPRLEPIVCSEV